jgi:hypothetical protein
MNWVLFTCKDDISLEVERIRSYDSSPVLKNRLMPHSRTFPVTVHDSTSCSPIQAGAVSGGLMIAVPMIKGYSLLP